MGARGAGAALPDSGHRVNLWQDSVVPAPLSPAPRHALQPTLSLRPQHRPRGAQAGLASPSQGCSPWTSLPCPPAPPPTCAPADSPAVVAQGEGRHAPSLTGMGPEAAWLREDQFN